MSKIEQIHSSHFINLYQTSTLFAFGVGKLNSYQLSDWYMYPIKVDGKSYFLEIYLLTMGAF